jgi:hypothetical protein
MTEIIVTRRLKAHVKQWSPNTRKDHPMELKVTMKFAWQGGPYIEVGYLNRKPAEVINVWNYETDKASTEFSREGLTKVVDAWIAEYDDDNPNNSVPALLQDSTNWYL